jgi:DNA-3-methyladenine glycosylase
VQFGLGGHAYIFTVHTHHQFCFVTGGVDVSDVILIRGIEPLHGIEEMRLRRNNPENDKLLGNGPGKLCVSLNITKSLYGIDLTDKRSELFIIDDEFSLPDEYIVQAPRVGIDYAEEFKDVPSRSYIKGNPYVSKK